MNFIFSSCVSGKLRNLTMPHAFNLKWYFITPKESQLDAFHCIMFDSNFSPSLILLCNFSKFHLNLSEAVAKLKVVVWDQLWVQKRCTGRVLSPVLHNFAMVRTNLEPRINLDRQIWKILEKTRHTGTNSLKCQTS